MPTIVITKTKLRRGTDDQRKLVTFDQGEIVYTTDTKRVFVGTGTTYGGLPIGTIVHPPITNYVYLSTVKAEINDLVNVNNIFYQLINPDYSDLTSWKNVGTQIDTNVLEYDSSNTLTLKNDSISARYLANSTINYPLTNESEVLELLYDTNHFELNSNQLSLKSGNISEQQITSNALSSGLKGGFDGSNSTKIQLDVNPSYFTFYSNTLNINPNPQWVGKGLESLTVNSTLTSINVKVDNSTLEVDSGTNTLKLKSVTTAGSSEWTKVTIDSFGRTLSLQSSIYDTLTGNSTKNSNNSLSAIFNGTPAHTLSGAIPGLQITEITAKNSSGATVTLSSAGFITFEGNVTTRTGQTVGRFAIPIFAY